MCHFLFKVYTETESITNWEIATITITIKVFISF